MCSIRKKFSAKQWSKSRNFNKTISSNHKPIRNKAIATENKYIKNNTNIGESQAFYRMQQQSSSSSSISSLGSVRFCLFVYVYDANFVLKSLQMVDLIGFSRFTNSFLLFLHLAVSFFHYYYYFRYV